MADIMKREKRSVTYEDYLHFPVDGNRYEILEGELFMTPAPTTHHQKVLKNLAFELESFLRKEGGGTLYIAPVDLLFNRFVVMQPDLIYLSKEQAHLDTGKAIEGGAPELVVEILSPSSVALDRVFKFNVYARLGVQWYWIVDPGACVIEEFILAEAAYSLVAEHKGDGSFSPRLFTGFTTLLPGIWA